jgi:predicted MPP superfamily phosphohydrolase
MWIFERSSQILIQLLSKYYRDLSPLGILVMDCEQLPSGSCARLIIQYFWVAVIAIVTLTPLLVHSSATAPGSPVHTPPDKFNSSLLPVYFAHISDTHISPSYPDHSAHLSAVTSTLESKVRPDLLIHTGDLVDQTDPADPDAARPTLEQWLLYREIMANSSLDLLEVLGNHDAYGVLSPTSPKSYCFRHSVPRSGKGSLVRVIEKSGIRVVAFELIKFPFAQGTTAGWATVTKRLVTELEEALRSPSDAKHTILATHFPSGTILGLRTPLSASGKSLQDLVDQFDAVLSGHFHPRQACVGPFGASIEFVAPALRSVNRYQIIAFDNRRISYHSINTTTEIPAVVTMPVPFRQTRHTFPETSSEVRILAFSNESLIFHVTGAVTGTLNRMAEVKPGVWLYSLPMEVEPGVHKIRVSGALETEIEFAVAVDSPPYKYYIDFEGVYLHPWAFIMGYVLISIFYVLVLVGMFACGCFARWLESVSTWLLFIAVGPLLIGFRLRDLPTRSQIMLVVAVVWGMVLPIGFFCIEDHVAVIWSFGYLIDGQFIPDLMFPMWPLMYLEMVVQSFLIVLSLCNHRFHASFIIDFVVAGLLFVASEVAWILVGGTLANNRMWLGSIEFVVLPIVFSCTAVLTYCAKRIPSVDGIEAGETPWSDLLPTWGSERDEEEIV